MYQVNPVIRLNRLRAEHAAMIELARGTRLISFKSRGSPPDQYLVTYRCKGTVLVDGKVSISTRHAIEIFLHADYPAAAPRFRLRTPLFHPNFKFGDPNLQVCIEARNWTPKEPLDDLVLRVEGGRHHGLRAGDSTGRAGRIIVGKARRLRPAGGRP